jgi:hypothetical protein
MPWANAGANINSLRNAAMSAAGAILIGDPNRSCEPSSEASNG